jgi:hypothetical protein
MTYSHIRQMADSTPEETEKLRKRMQAEQALSAEVLAAPKESPSTPGTSDPAKSEESSSDPAKSGESSSDPGGKAPAEPKSNESGESPGQSAMKEVGAAAVGGVVDAVKGIGSNVNQALNTLGGKEIDPAADYTPSWLKQLDGIAPQNKTWWGSAARSIVQLGVLSVGVGKGGRAAGAKLGIGKAQTWMGGLGRNVATGAVAGNLSTFSTDEHNLTRTISDAVPWFPDVLATRDDDSPMMRRLKNTLEGAGFDVAFDVIAAGFRGRKLQVKAEARGANDALREQAIAAREEGSVLAKLQTDYREARKTMDVAKVARDAAKGTDLEAETLTAFTAAQDAHKAARKLYQDTKKTITGDDIAQAGADDAAKDRAKVRADNELENAQARFEEDPEFTKGADPWASDPDLFDPSDRAAVTSKGIRADTIDALRNVARVAREPGQAKGRLANILTETKREKILRGGNPAVRKVLDEMIDSIQSSDADFALEINGMKVSKEETINLVATQALKIMDTVANPEDLDALKDLLLSNSWKGDVNGVPAEFMNRVNTAATQLLIRTTSEELADLSNVFRSYEATGVVDTAHLGELLSNRLEFVLKEHKKAAYIRGSELQSMAKNWATQFLPKKADYARATAGIEQEVAEVMATVRGSLKDGDPRLLNHFITAASISDGNVRTLDDLATYMRKKIGMNGWRMGDPSSQGYQLQGLTSTFYNSVLSSPKTAMRAWAGTGLATFLRPTTMLLGGAMRRDKRIIAKSLAQFHALKEGLGDAVKMAQKSADAWIGAEGSVNANIVGARTPYHKTAEFKALKEWTELQGTVGDKDGLRWAEQLSAFNSHWLVNFGVGAMDTGDSFFRTLIGRMELKGQAFDEAWNVHGGKIDGNLVRTYEDKFKSLVFDEDGVVTDVAARMAGDEVSLTTPLDGIGKSLTEVVQAIPALRPFIMFPKTAINAASLLSTYTPILNGFVKEVDEVMNATIETAPAIMSKYGITDLAAAQAAYEGRVALGNVVVAGAVGMYLAGAVTGNGPADRTTRDIWQQLGWQARSIRVGDKWISYDGLEPFHTFFALTADIGDNLGDLGESIAADGLAKLGFLVAQNATNKTFLGGLSPLMDIIGGGTASAGASTAIAQTLNNIVPIAGTRNFLSQLFGPGLREVNDNVWDKIRNRNPILRQQLPAQQDPLDGSLVKAYDPLTNFFNQTLPYQINPDWGEVREKLRTSGFDVKTSLTTGLLGEKLDKASQAAIRGEMGKENIVGQLRTLFASQKYKEWDAKLRRERDLGRPAAVSGLQQNWHLIEIQNIFDNAKKSAIQRHAMKTGESQATRDAAMKQITTNAAKQGDITPSLQNILNVTK